MIYVRELKVTDITDEYVDSLNNPELNSGIVTKSATRESCAAYIQEHLETPDALIYGVFESIEPSESEHLVGTVTLKSVDQTSHTCVLGIFVWKSGQGIGQKAIELVGAEMKEKGIRKIILNVSPDNTRAIRCYEKCGFVQDTIYMSWDLNHSRSLALDQAKN